VKEIKEIRVSTTDPDCGFMSRENKQEMFCYLDHRTTLDSGYLTNPICKGLSDRNIFGVIAYRRFHPTSGLFPKSLFTYDKERDLYICQNNQELTYVQQHVRVIESINRIRRNVKTVHFFPIVHV
jgi:hypothetical protein